MNEQRVRLIKKAPVGEGPIVYWMQRDQRTQDNWALLYAQEIAIKQKAPLGVVFCLVPAFLGATIRQYEFMLKGLEEVEKNLRAKNIGFFLLLGDPPEEISRFISKNKISQLIMDFNPLRIKDKWIENLFGIINIPFFEVDAHNVVPCWVASPKQEYGAYTLRPKIHRLLDEYLDAFPRLKKHPVAWKGTVKEPRWERARKSLSVDRGVPEVHWLKPGEKAAHKILTGFIKNKLEFYQKNRNDPNKDGQSNISPYLHFGQMSAQRVALDVLASNASKASKEAFLEELIVRKELADNFCYYNELYDSTGSFPRWAISSLEAHQKDKRAYTYSLKEFENARTHDKLWNAAQMEMVVRGKMHGYMRMYWAKKILEWSKSPEEAMKTAIFLNDKYELDGRDPNGYTGVVWSIGGVHDRPWKERPVFGKIRYMSASGCRKKFDVDAYIKSWLLARGIHTP